LQRGLAGSGTHKIVIAGNHKLTFDRDRFEERLLKFQDRPTQLEMTKKSLDPDNFVRYVLYIEGVGILNIRALSSWDIRYSGRLSRVLFLTGPSCSIMKPGRQSSRRYRLTLTYGSPIRCLGVSWMLRLMCQRIPSSDMAVNICEMRCLIASGPCTICSATIMRATAVPQLMAELQPCECAGVL